MNQSNRNDSMKEKVYSVILNRTFTMKTLYMKFEKKYLLSFLIVHLYLIGSATNYYVSNSGSDSNSGLSPDKAWQTLAKVSGFSFSNNDVLLFKCGDVWVGQLTLTAKGTNTNNLTISSYGTGNKPEIRAWGDFPNWNVAGTWSVYSGNVYRASVSYEITRLWLNGKQVKRGASQDALSSLNPWFCTSTNIYILTNGTNPASYFNSIIYPPRYPNSVYLSGAQNIVFDGLNLSGGGNGFTLKNCKNIEIRNCEIGYRVLTNGVNAYAVLPDSTNYINIHDNVFASGDSLYNTIYNSHPTQEAIHFGNGICHSKAYNNYIDSWTHNGVYILSVDAGYPCHDNEVYKNFITAPLIDYARGLNVDQIASGYNNSVHDNIVINTANANQFNGNGLKVYNNLIIGSRGCPYSEKPEEGQGISIEAYGTKPATHMEIFNNVITRCANQGIKIWGTDVNEKSFNNIHDNWVYDNDTVTNYQLWIYSALKTIHDNTYAKNVFYSSKSQNVIRYAAQNFTVSGIQAYNTGSENDVFVENKDSIPQNTTIVYNERSTNKVITLSIPMVDRVGKKYNSSITLQPYSFELLFKDNSPPVHFDEYVSICNGSNYNGWTKTGTYTRTLTTKSGADSIVTTYLTVNPTYTITKDTTIQAGETYNGWTKTGTYTRTLSSVFGCDSTIITNLTVVVAKQGEVLPTHFISVWQNQIAVNPMNIKVVSATKDGLPLAVNDEIALYSGSICVGAVKLTQPIDGTNNSTFVTIPASQNDGSGNGFTTNDTIVVKIWDGANHREMVVQNIRYLTDDASWLTTGRYSANATSVIEFKSYTEITQTISLVKGYNMMSTFVSADNPNVSTVTKPLIDSGALVKVQDEYGNSYENWGSYGGWVNNLGNLKSTEGYKIKVATNCVLKVTGQPIALPLDITLNAGWNIISFPHTDVVNAMNVIQPLIDQNKLVKIQDEQGNSIEDWGAFGGWVNGIGNFIPGKAYKVKVNSNTSLTIR